MIRVLARDSGLHGSGHRLVCQTRRRWSLASLGETLNDTHTVTGRLKEELPEAPPEPDRTRSRLVFVVGRAWGRSALPGGGI